jgi:hypothetical protein
VRCEHPTRGLLEPEQFIATAKEITETSAVQTPLAPLVELTRLGVGLALDDFGTGFSSLERGSALAADRHAEDRSLVRRGPRSRARRHRDRRSGDRSGEGPRHRSPRGSSTARSCSRSGGSAAHAARASTSGRPLEAETLDGLLGSPMPDEAVSRVA